MNNTPWRLEHATWPVVATTPYNIAVLPWGATEAHNRHLPYATDTIEASAIAHDAARRAWERGARTVVLPTVPFGVNTGQADIPLCLNMNPTTQAALLDDLIEVVARAGISRFVILNGHGGNDFRAMLRERVDAPVFLCVIDWYAVLDASTYFDEPGDHAGELETSVMLHVAPDTVRPLGEAGPGHARTFRVRGLRERWAWAPRHWTSVTDDTGVGNPRHATAAKGERFFDAASTVIADFLVELAAADLDDLYEDAR